MKEHLFVYGQFRDIAKKLLKGYIFCGRTTINGKIYRVNEEYPGFVEGEGKVYGDVYLIDNELFPELDEFEGEEYVREKFMTALDIECWVYRYKDDVSGFKEIKGGDWWLK